MPLEKIAVFLVIGKQRRQALESLKRQRHTLCKPMQSADPVERSLALCAFMAAPLAAKR